MNYEALLQLTQSFLTSLAIIIGGYWSYKIYKQQRDDCWNLQIDILHEIYPYNDKQIIYFNIIITNKGKIKISPSIFNLNIQRLPDNLQMNDTPHWDSSRQTINYSILTESNPEVKKALLDNYDINCLYNIEPNGKYTECASLVIEQDVSLITEVEFRNYENNEAFYTYKFINVPKLRNDATNTNNQAN